MTYRIPPRSGTAFALEKGQRLTVIDPEGEQVADLAAFSAADPREAISNGRTIDYASKLFFTTGDLIYSNRSSVMFEIVHDDVGRHDFLLTPCSAEMFRKLYGEDEPHRGCFGNLAAALEPYGIQPDQIPVAFNVFMNVPVDGKTGEIRVDPPLSKPGDTFTIEAKMDLIVGLTACSAGQSNNFTYKPIDYRIE
ncbi:urea carboxylase-associated protein [Pacificimonas flava]|uniref:Urea carboxylase-associated protein n=3 Tax=Sphingosinicellaceae TaxID=2820280 RepID=A0A219B2A7_9SPHN|nr:urea carboxylase-associated family protein [Pacificimonas aurantium]OWV31958.1 urea carboxylase-associated protein [Pacificimonas flava]